jgi:hypothetical protein
MLTLRPRPKKGVASSLRRRPSNKRRHALHHILPPARPSRLACTLLTSLARRCVLPRQERDVAPSRVLVPRYLGSLDGRVGPLGHRPAASNRPPMQSISPGRRGRVAGDAARSSQLGAGRRGPLIPPFETKIRCGKDMKWLHARRMSSRQRERCVHGGGNRPQRRAPTRRPQDVVAAARTLRAWGRQSATEAGANSAAGQRASGVAAAGKCSSRPRASETVVEPRRRS